MCVCGPLRQGRSWAVVQLPVVGSGRAAYGGTCQLADNRARRLMPGRPGGSTPLVAALAHPPRALSGEGPWSHLSARAVLGGRLTPEPAAAAGGCAGRHPTARVDTGIEAPCMAMHYGTCQRSGVSHCKSNLIRGSGIGCSGRVSEVASKEAPASVDLAPGVASTPGPFRPLHGSLHAHPR